LLLNKKILIDKNPIKHNEKSDLIIREILSSIEIKNKLKRSPQKPSWDINASKLTAQLNRTSAARISISAAPGNASNNGSLSNEGEYAPSNFSMPNNIAAGVNYLSSANTNLNINRRRMSLAASLKQDSSIRRKLKANNILIEQENDTDESLANKLDDYLIIGGKNDESLRTDQPSVEPTASNANALRRGSVFAKFPGSFTSEYDPNNLQKELENLKKMRQSYGTDWLLSTPNMMLKKEPNEQEQGSAATGAFSNFKVNRPAAATAALLNRVNEDKSLNVSASLENVIESYAVYRLYNQISIGGAGVFNYENTIETKLRIISLNDKYLVERDETNTDVLNLYEFADLVEAYFPLTSLSFSIE
jgi:hypothetical protein